ncbi:MAG: alpha-L-rhamnosidase-related protein [Saccharofermentanales bacterium]
MIHYNDLEIIRKAYNGFKKWNECLKAHTTDGLVDYTYWGDWASPSDCCLDAGGGYGYYSSVTPGLLMSTGYYFYNYKVLAEFARKLGLDAEVEENLKGAQEAQHAFLHKWFDPMTGLVSTGSQGAQSFALWLGILPEENRIQAARILHEAVVAAGYRLTTGNLCSRYVMDMLVDYGYTEDAYKLITREEWPSLGFMLANEATTIWERFELMSMPMMNSLNHAMYAAVDEWFYTRLAGVTPLEDGWGTISIKPAIPEKMIYINTVIDTIKGDIIVKWENKFGKPYLYVTVPFGCTAIVHLPSSVEKIMSGYHIFEWKN